MDKSFRYKPPSNTPCLGRTFWID